MAGVAVANLPKGDHDELCCIYSALILHDEGMEITVNSIQADKIAKLVNASGNEIEKYWPLLFANALKGQNVGSLLTNLSGSAPAPVALAAGGASAEAETKKEEKKEEKEDAEDALEGGLGFDEEW